jgi:hypothetical protein
MSEIRVVGQARREERCLASFKWRNAPDDPNFLTEGRVLFRHGVVAAAWRCAASLSRRRLALAKNNPGQMPSINLDAL